MPSPHLRRRPPPTQQNVGQRLARVEEAARHRPLRNVQYSGDFAVAKALDLLEHQHLAVAVAEPGQRPPQPFARLLALLDPLGAGLGIGGPQLQSFVERLEIEPRLASAERVAALIAQNLEEPGREAPLQVEAPQRTPRLHKGVLQRVGRVVRVAHHAQRDPHPRPFVGSHDGLEEARAAPLALSQQFPFDVWEQAASRL